MTLDSHQMCAVTGAKLGQLEYLVRRKFITPVVAAKRRGLCRRFDVSDAIRVRRAIQFLNEARVITLKQAMDGHVFRD